MITSALSTDPKDGAADSITVGNGNDIIIGGVGGDTINAAIGNSIIIGDDGALTYAGGILTLATTTDIGVGGNDVISTGSGNDIVFGGFGADQITTGTGNTMAFGDDGQVIYDARTGVILVSANSINPGEGGQRLDHRRQRHRRDHRRRR